MMDEITDLYPKPGRQSLATQQTQSTRYGYVQAAPVTLESPLKLIQNADSLFCLQEWL